jgi:VIT1/CCC1 family predicted Fe2+/Mn2+ transporter
MGVLAVVLFGLANLFGDGVSMALGAYLSTKSEQDIYQRAWNKEAHEIVHNTDMEIEESVEILIEQGMKQEDATATVAIMQQYPTLWTKWMMDNELGMSDVRDDNAFMQGVITLVSFLIFGTIPLLPYLVLATEADMWMTSLTMTAVALFLLGITRWYVTRIDFVKTVSQMVLLG